MSSKPMVLILYEENNALLAPGQVLLATATCSHAGKGKQRTRFHSHRNADRPAPSCWRRSMIFQVRLQAANCIKHLFYELSGNLCGFDRLLLLKFEITFQ